ncbi:NAD-dependent epimerase/dehydratase family protein [Modestobacter muralis]|uniref:NAD-dependent epimerase/dehydratase family protein n=1 Tax=Modestobacter muralis TaxID=1608614 RepID=A0A6P0H1U7_9ACTN|nr:NAD-dependent epimerase/dehydratase family protein [Modestobacter muralis]NEK92805.1 NAD-dependent epimerase/dehydratase family protein [Modestobacter muralis]NEN49572.1 NAD-dependent epimerase/dehydratase family protein [Modestobacter muralis]
MDVFLTGGTGLVGSALLTALLSDGHDVHALARSDASARALEAAGATVVRGSVEDTAVLAEAARAADGVVHTAAAADGKDADRDAALLDAVLPALAGSNKPYVHTSGVWVHGAGAIDEDTPFAPPALTAWRLPLDARVRAAADDGVRSVVIAPGIVYGRGLGLPNVVKDGPRTDDGALVLPGSGAQTWTTVHTEDLARLYVAALTEAAPGAYYLGVNGQNPTVAEIGAAASRGAGLDERTVSSTEAETEARLGALAGALDISQQATGARARAELGWAPTGPSLLEDLGSGSYAG